ncbi:MAG: helix-turn-helix transcriptional regulator [Bacteriovoracaceae bacterium]|nr:helix-turn-helix transcriptional regulator [Bacteriovoracaceae bacterium]
MKVKKITYKMLAKKIGLSESGLKKIFSSRDCSYERLNQICQALDTCLADIIVSHHETKMQEAKFDESQERFFVKNFDYFNFQWKLVNEGMSWEEIQDEFGLSYKETFKYLKKLDELGIIELNANNRVKKPKPCLRRWVGKGPLTKKVYKEWASKIIEDVVANDSPSDLFILRYLTLSKDSISELRRSLEELELEYLKKSQREHMANDLPLEKVRFLSTFSKGSYVPKLK